MDTMTQADLWQKFCEALEEGRLSVILEGVNDSIDGGLIVTDVGDVVDFLTGR